MSDSELSPDGHHADDTYGSLANTRATRVLFDPRIVAPVNVGVIAARQRSFVEF